MAHIDKRAERRYRVRYRDPAGKERSKTFTRRSDAKRFKTVIEDELARGRWVDPKAGRISFGSFCIDALQPRQHIRPATTARIDGFLKVQVLPTFADSPIGKITRLSVQEWIDRLACELGPRTVRDSYRVFAGIMREAVRRGLIRQSPCFRILLPRVERTEPRFLDPGQVEDLASAIDPRYRSLIYAGAYLGLRWSELAAIKRLNLDRTCSHVRVVGALERVGHGWRYSEQMKTLRSRRSLAIPTFLAEMLLDQIRTGPPSDFVFSSPGGQLLHYGNFRRRFWNPAVARAGLAGVTPHALRHTCVALMIAEGANPLMGQRQLGHADLRMTLGTYGHLFPHWDDQVAERMHQLWQRTKRDRSAACARPGT